MDISALNRIKEIAIIALASDDHLVEQLVLKGGNAIAIYLANFNDSGNVSRTSYDLDYSISEGDFKEDIEIISERIKKTLEQTFLENEYVVVDYRFFTKPKKANEATKDFWGGYKVEFKLIGKREFDSVKGNNDAVRRNAIQIHANNSPIFELEFSKYEHVTGNKDFEYEGFKIRIYTPEMIVFEKLRALCQQLPSYSEVVPGFSPRTRARDFFDIHFLMEEFAIDPETQENMELISNIFSAKKVPLDFIQKLRSSKEFHAENWTDVKSTVSSLETLRGFDYYFEYVVSKFEKITFP